MLALYRCGRQADALGGLPERQAVLVEQLGIEPSPPLRELEQAILRQDPALELAAARGAGPLAVSRRARRVRARVAARARGAARATTCEGSWCSPDWSTSAWTWPCERCSAQAARAAAGGRDRRTRGGVHVQQPGRRRRPDGGRA